MTNPTTTEAAQALVDWLRNRLTNLDYSDLEGVVIVDSDEELTDITNAAGGLADRATIRVSSTVDEVPVEFEFVVNSTDPVLIKSTN
ncbi:hypothetical protein [Actinokineospora globicatena]|uniref:Uncharacterized protein n=1 Tax=Actinokineospora globicatena TaxID=103729 RepID=A0A9W6VAB3_9PSEU|nr:hypothetical protein [Actinokineospora globicatena]GLW91803.1 hypothetical protein Aglo03_26190 [Actinokineospora globicatena]